MTDDENEFTRILDGIAVRACDVIERECAVEAGRDHHVALLLLAAGNVLLAWLGHQDAYAATRDLMPPLLVRVHAEALRRQNERDTCKN